MFTTLKKHVTHEPTQQEPLPGMEQNNAGGYSRVVDHWAQLNRFLILGTTGGTYYVKEKDLTKQNLDAVNQCLEEDGARFVETVQRISESGEAPKNDPALYCLALALSAKAQTTREMAYGAIPKIARTFTHLSHLVFFIRKGKMRGWGRALTRAFSNWYNQKPLLPLVNQVIKYWSRDGISQKDVYRLAHPAKLLGKDIMADRRGLYDYIAKGTEPTGTVVTDSYPLQVLTDAISLKTQTDQETIIQLISKHGLPLETIPTEQQTPAVYRAVLEGKPGLTWIARNLGNMTKRGVFDDTKMIDLVEQKLTDREALKKARVHPLQLFQTFTIYKSGQGLKGSNTWVPVPRLLDALSEAFYASFDYLESSGKKILYCVDVSGSMHEVLPEFGNARLHAVAAVMAMASARAEKNFQFMTFDTSARFVPVSGKQRVVDAARAISESGNGGTDTSLPFKFAREKKLDVDLFVVLTDSETWAGVVHPETALADYRRAMNKPDAKAINVAMVANKFSSVDIKDPLTLEIIGFSSQIPSVISLFANDSDGNINPSVK